MIKNFRASIDKKFSWVELEISVPAVTALTHSSNFDGFRFVKTDKSLAEFVAAYAATALRSMQSEGVEFARYDIEKSWYWSKRIANEVRLCDPVPVIGIVAARAINSKAERVWNCSDLSLWTLEKITRDAK